MTFGSWRGRLVGSVAASACVLMLMTGCAAAETPPAAAQNRSLWTMPLDEFAVFEPSLSGYAEQLMIAKCLGRHGYDWPVPWQDTDFPHPENVNDAALKIFTLDLARRYGYHDAPAPNPAEAVAWAEFTAWANDYDPDAQFESRFQACGQDARLEQTLASEEGLNYITGLALQAQDEIAADDAVRDAARSWRSCLSEHVTFELPQDPWLEMPTKEMAHEYGVYGPDLTEVASSAEISVAEADARCRESSGWAETRYEAEWAAQEVLVRNNRDKLERIRREAVALHAELKEQIAENAPSR